MDKILRWISGISFAALLVGASFVAPIDFTPLRDQPFYDTMMDRVDSVQPTEYLPEGALKVGWSKFSLVPDHPMPMAGYKPRPDFKSVHDSLYVRILSIDNGGVVVYFVSADLLLFPPALKAKITSRLGAEWPGFIYYSATHTHTSVGGWDPSFLGQILMGNYDDEYMNHLADQVVMHLKQATGTAVKSTISYWERDVKNYISNRIDRFAPVDSKFRGLIIEREDGKKAIQIILGAHPTFVSKRFTALSGDFPAALQSELSVTYDFTQYMSGMVGSQRFRGLFGTYDFDLVEQAGELLANFITEKTEQEISQPVEIKTGRIPIEYGDSQLRITNSLRIRNWLFKAVSQPLQGEITCLQLGNVLYLGMPCDFSGELFVKQKLGELAESNGLNLVITSFNGDYTGYITADEHYLTSDDEEVRILNWVGPYFGQYSSEIVKAVIRKAD
ncbi:MAG: hypothetical protein AB7O48_14245 [Cyclobacteriaceae bacterium]